MDPRFITKRLHAFLDYPVAINLIALPLVLGLGESSALALWLSIGTGVAAFALTLLTDHQLGVFRVLPYRVHLAVDFSVGVLFVLAPFAFGFQGMDLWYYLLNGGAVLAVVGLHKPELPSQTAIARRASAA